MIEVSHPERVMWPGEGLTKGDLVAHYEQVAPLMLPHVRGRPLTLQRFHGPVEEGGFYQKDASEHFPDIVRRVPVERKGSKGGTVNHAYVCDEPEALVYLANQGTVTFHVWPSRADALEQPDVVVFDLDPPEGGASLGVVRDAARAFRDLLEEVGLVPYVQTSGSKGYHVVAPIERGPGYEEVSAFTDGLAEVLAERDPERLTTAFRKDKRRGRVFLDTRRNAWAQTFVAPYSVRPRAGAPVATPIDWHEIGRVEPQRYTIGNIARRLGQKDDPWADIWDHARPLPGEEALAALHP